jgi:hypothetical protein
VASGGFLEFLKITGGDRLHYSGCAQRLCPYYFVISLEPKSCVLEILSWMSKLKMVESSRTSKTHKRGVES